MAYQLGFLHFSRPIQLLLIFTQFICYLNQYYVVVFLFGPLPYVQILILTLTNFIALTSLYFANITHKDVPPKYQNSQFCKKCKTWIHNRDHHCIFIGRCVQKQNYQYFFTYVLYSYLHSCVLLQCLIRNYDIFLILNQIQIKYLLPIIGALISGAYFFIFTGGLLAGSIRSIIFGIYTVEQIKKLKQPAFHNDQLKQMWFSSQGRKQLCIFGFNIGESFKKNWKIMIGQQIGLKQILFPIQI